LAMTVLFLVLYLCLVEALPLLPFDAETVMRLQIALSPRMALARVLGEPDADDRLFASLSFSGTMTVLAILLNGWGIWRLRVWNPSGEPLMQREVVGEKAAVEPDERVHAAPGKARPVWANPILWREIATRAYGRRPLVVKTAYLVVLGLVCYY